MLYLSDSFAYEVRDDGTVGGGILSARSTVDVCYGEESVEAINNKKSQLYQCVRNISPVIKNQVSHLDIEDYPEIQSLIVDYTLALHKSGLLGLGNLIKFA